MKKFSSINLISASSAETRRNHCLMDWVELFHFQSTYKESFSAYECLNGVLIPYEKKEKFENIELESLI